MTCRSSSQSSWPGYVPAIHVFPWGWCSQDVDAAFHLLTWPASSLPAVIWTKPAGWRRKHWPFISRVRRKTVGPFPDLLLSERSWLLPRIRMALPFSSTRQLQMSKACASTLRCRPTCSIRSIDMWNERDSRDRAFFRKRPKRPWLLSSRPIRKAVVCLTHHRVFGSVSV
jgi:hypothetical protein